MAVSTALVVLAVAAGAVVLLACALAPALGRRVPDDVVAAPRTGYGVVAGGPVVPGDQGPRAAAPRRTVRPRHLREHDLAA